MTSGGLTMRRFAFWAAVTFFVIAMLCAIESKTGGDDVYRGLALLALVFGTVSAVGVWACGLPKSENPEDAEWMDVVK
ncbi:hypothetical protein [Pseudarthrobacter sp. NIBRBAC000502770]|uniref:hypothetical protein n=1 Tax=Pseudarthrobacter sp. NIBRBAC000502770 TaxID=2590785 RepID=UPI0011405C24|nr:hypothetical protein [Pseudarthrobacter sp. NIBRBAC000502770]QDG90689.1 hypothetical protein NIBR502770_20925 [Pseudarthrobacter sp. NIBRBAC000502770]